MWLKQGQIEVECGDESEFGSCECGDECGQVYAKKNSFTAIPLPSLHPSLHPIPNQSKPIVPLLSFSFIITFSYIFITISYNLQLYHRCQYQFQLLLFLSYNFSLYHYQFHSQHHHYHLIGVRHTISHTIVIKTSSNSITKSNKTSSHNDQQHQFQLIIALLILSVL